MNLTELIAKTRKIADDPAVEESEIVALLNEASLVVADRVRLPSLAIGAGSTVSVAGDYKNDMPTNYHNWAYLVKADDVQVNLRSNMEELLMLFSSSLSNVGDVTDVTIQGNLIIFQPSPATPVDLDLFFSEKPIEFELASPSAIPSWLPTRFHKMLAVYAGAEIWDDVETGDDEAQVNTQNQRNRFEKMLSELDQFVTDRKTQ